MIKYTCSTEESTDTVFVLVEVTEGPIYSIAGVEGTPGWMDLARRYKIPPIFNSTIVGGDVFTYVYETTDGPDATYYRYVAADYSIDAFYATFDGSSVSDLIAEKKIYL